MLESIEKELIGGGCIVESNAPMHPYTTIGTGGKAMILCTANSIKSAEYAYNFLYNNALPFTVMGKGSNILVSDKGYKGVILRFCGDNYITDNGGGLFTASAGMTAAKVISFATASGFTGGEFAATIPGTLGGLIAMNAGCFGGEMKDITTFCECIIEGKKLYLNNSGCEFDYRKSIFTRKNAIILRASVKLKKGDAKQSAEEIKKLILQRKKTQPDRPSAGSVFKRKEGILPAKLIDEAGLKGLKIGGAEVSKVHSGFIINNKNATSDDVYRLINKVKQIIYTKYAVMLEEEILFIGEF